MSDGLWDTPGPIPPQQPLPAALNPRGRSGGGPGRAGRGGPSGPAGPGGGRRGRRAARALAWIATVLSAVVLLGSGAAYGLYLHYNSNITRVGLGSNTAGAPEATGAENFLLVGSDSRNGATPAQLQEAHTTKDGGAVNTDVMMVVHLSPHDGKVTFLSVPRDSWVPIAGHGYGRINSAFAIGGANLLVNTVENVTGMHIDHFMMVNFFGFMNISDAIGGVRVCLPQAAHDSYSGLNLSAGYHTIKGPTALAFVRQRHGLAAGDLARIQRQQEFIGAVIRKTESAGVLLNPFRLNSLLNAVTTSLTVDSGLSINGLRSLALRLRHLDPAHVTFLTYPVANAAYWPSGTVGVGPEVVQLDTVKGNQLVATILANRLPTSSSSAHPSSSPLVVPPSAISVQVQNGTTTAGLAAKAAGALQALGFTVAGVGNAPAQVSATVVRYGPSRAQSAQTLAAAVPGATLQEDSSLGGTVYLELGPNYTGTQQVTIGSVAPAASAPSASAAPSTTSTAAKDPCAV